MHLIFVAAMWLYDYMCSSLSLMQILSYLHVYAFKTIEWPFPYYNNIFINTKIFQKLLAYLRYLGRHRTSEAKSKSDMANLASSLSIVAKFCDAKIKSFIQWQFSTIKGMISSCNQSSNSSTLGFPWNFEIFNLNLNS